LPFNRAFLYRYSNK